MRGLRVMIYDATWHGSKPDQWFLTTSWILGGWLYRALGRIDEVYGATSWLDAVAWLNAVDQGREIAEIQYWGHGRWGRVMIGTDRLDARVLDDDAHPMHDPFRAVAARLTPASLVWFRTCMTFGTAVGQRFASSCARFFGCRVAGHTYVVGPLQSGLHSLAPGEVPSWPVDEGVARGDERRSPWTRLYDVWLGARDALFGGALGRSRAKRARAENNEPAAAASPSSTTEREPSGLMSSKQAPNTITCLDGAVPHEW